MEMLLVIGGTLMLCWVVDRLFTKTFRSKPQHMSGKAVRLSKRNGVGGLLLMLLGIIAVIVGVTDSWLLIAGGVLLILLGAALIVYYMTFGVFYDDDGFILTTFGRKSVTYRYKDIKAQQLYSNYGQTVIELYLKGGRTVQLQANMSDVYPFLDHAFDKWLLQTGRDKENCSFYDPDNSCWFPRVEG